jgi:transcriptional regulator with GAF, ATPase, and Fis domain
MRPTVLVFSAVRQKFEKIPVTNTSAPADLFYAAIVCSIHVIQGRRMLRPPKRECKGIIVLARSLTKDWKEIQNLEARINSLKVLALTLLREVESLEEQEATTAPGALNLQTEVHRFEAEMIRSALIRTGGRQRRAARLLGMKTTTLNSKIRRYHINTKEAS